MEYDTKYMYLTQLQIVVDILYTNTFIIQISSYYRENIIPTTCINTCTLFLQKMICNKCKHKHCKKDFKKPF